MLSKIEHIALALPSIGEVRKFYEQALAHVCEQRQRLHSAKVEIAFFDRDELFISNVLEASHDGSQPHCPFWLR